MSHIAIRVENLGKQYLIGGDQIRDFSLVGTFANAIKAPFQSLIRRNGDSGRRTETELHWALRDVSFELEHGTVLGIIGENGSGKSTLLKIISRIVEPTTGRVDLYGRVGSLLEVGMGFHPELSGRENIYLNGAILGMTKIEIGKRIDEIIDFSGIEQFIDTPVKRYSSGMYIRLAFSVAVQLDPEILVLDEVLAVGDQVFQRKCLNKMHSVARDGRTVLFVSHSIESVRSLCDKCILLKEGSVIKEDETEKVVDFYLQTVYDYIKDVETVEKIEDIPFLIAQIPPDQVFRLRNISILQNGRASLDIHNGSPVQITIDYDVQQDTRDLYVMFRLLNSAGTLLFESLNNGQGPRRPVIRRGQYSSNAIIPADLLKPGAHELHVGAGIYKVRNCMPKNIKFMLEVRRTGRVNIAYPDYRLAGELAPFIDWTTSSRSGIEWRSGQEVDRYRAIFVIEDDPEGESVLCNARLCNGQGDTITHFSCDDEILIELCYQIRVQRGSLYGCIQITGANGLPVLVTYSHDNQPDPLNNLPVGTHLIRVKISPRTLGVGDYSVQFSSATTKNGLVMAADPGTILKFAVFDNRTSAGNSRLGCMSAVLDWKVKPVDTKSSLGE